MGLTINIFGKYLYNNNINTFFTQNIVLEQYNNFWKFWNQIKWIILIIINIIKQIILVCMAKFRNIIKNFLKKNCIKINFMLI